jgi:hypothetical protein
MELGMSYEEKFSDKEYCLSELAEAWKIFTNKSFSLEKSDLLLKGLVLMLFYCPEDLISLVEATIYECERRTIYLYGV